MSKIRGARHAYVLLITPTASLLESLLHQGHEDPFELFRADVSHLLVAGEVPKALEAKREGRLQPVPNLAAHLAHTHTMEKKIYIYRT